MWFGARHDAIAHLRPGAGTGPVDLPERQCAAAHLALADGDPARAATALGAAEGLRRRAGLRAWPSMRRIEAELGARVAQAIDPAAYDAAFAAGAELTHRAAAALARGDLAPTS